MAQDMSPHKARKDVECCIAYCNGMGYCNYVERMKNVEFFQHPHQWQAQSSVLGTSLNMSEMYVQDFSISENEMPSCGYSIGGN